LVHLPAQGLGALGAAGDAVALGNQVAQFLRQRFGRDFVFAPEVVQHADARLHFAQALRVAAAAGQRGAQLGGRFAEVYFGLVQHGDGGFQVFVELHQPLQLAFGRGGGGGGGARVFTVHHVHGALHALGQVAGVGQAFELLLQFFHRAAGQVQLLNLADLVLKIVHALTHVFTARAEFTHRALKVPMPAVQFGQFF